MRRVIGLALALGMVLSVAAAAQKPAGKTWTGKIGDSMCKDKHMAAEHSGKKMTDAECVAMCVKKGEKYVFVSEGKVYQLSNQNSKTIAQYAGQQVELTGELKGDSITASTVRAVAEKPSK